MGIAGSRQETTSAGTFIGAAPAASRDGCPHRAKQCFARLYQFTTSGEAKKN
jgi:hypothetical protein